MTYYYYSVVQPTWTFVPEGFGVTWTLAEPEVIEPDQEPDDDTEAELPDVREDTVPDDPA